MTSTDPLPPQRVTTKHTKAARPKTLTLPKDELVLHFLDQTQEATPIAPATIPPWQSLNRVFL